jgi:hypothetical protein
LIAKGVRLPDFSLLEQIDLLEVERKNLMIDFGKEAIRIMSTAKDSDKALALISHLRKIFFIDEERKEKEKISKQADELLRLGQLTYRIAPKEGRGILEITKP